MRRLLAVIFAALLLVSGARAALANTTDTVCDSAPSKYWCFYVDYTPQAGYVSANYVYFSGGLGGSADYFFVWQADYWRQDPSTLLWYHLNSYAPSAHYFDVSLGTWHSLGNGGYYVADWAEVTAQMRHHVISTGLMACGEEQDFHLSSPIGVYISNAGGGGPC